MPIYRALITLSGPRGVDIYPGSLQRFQWLNESQIQKLTDVGAIARIAPPPLAELPGWKTRATRLSGNGVINAEQFLEMDNALIAKALRVKEETVNNWKQEIENNWLTVQPQISG